MNIKIKILCLALAGAFLAFPAIAFAQTASPVPTGVARGANRDANLSRLNGLCTDAVNARVTSLNNANTRINGLVKLTADLKQKYSGEISTDISSLQALAAACTSDFNSQNIAQLRTDYKNVFLQYRIYAVFLPQTNLLVASDTMDVTADKLTDLAGKLQTRMTSAGNPGNTLSLLSDMNAKIADAKTQYASVQSQITSLTPQSFNSDPTGTTNTLKNARSEIQTGASDLRAAFADAKQIVAALKLVKSSPVPSPVATP